MHLSALELAPYEHSATRPVVWCRSPLFDKAAYACTEADSLPWSSLIAAARVARFLAGWRHMDVHASVRIVMPTESDRMDPDRAVRVLAYFHTAHLRDTLEWLYARAKHACRMLAHDGMASSYAVA